MPLLETLLASDLNFGRTGPVFLFLANFCTVSTHTELVSVAPLSARLDTLPVFRKKTINSQIETKKFIFDVADGN